MASKKGAEITSAIAEQGEHGHLVDARVHGVREAQRDQHHTDQRRGPSLVEEVGELACPSESTLEPDVRVELAPREVLRVAETGTYLPTPRPPPAIERLIH